MLDYQSFKNPDVGYRSAPFWSWNDQLELPELIRQIHGMQEQGMGGFFMHPRGGMPNEYMGADFLNMVAECVAEAEKLGMKAWLYDEDRFPSGGAGGLVVKNHEEFRIKALTLREVPAAEFRREDRILRVYAWVEKGAVSGDGWLHRDVMGLNRTGLRDVTGCAEVQLREMSGSLLVIEWISMPEQYLWNMHSYTDLCCKEAVDKFIEVTHEKYRESVGEHFGKAIPGIFTDEPYFDVGNTKTPRLPWTLHMEEEFEKLKGYRLREHAVSLFVDTGDYRKVRYDYWDVISGMFTRAFTENVYRWCEENDLEFTGHFWEHAFPLPTHNGSVMPNYEFMHQPGIDMLFNRKDEPEQVGNDLIVKEVSSVGNQMGKKRILSETYGASGWDLDFKDQKRIADWQFALGINFMCQHLVHYSLKGYRKRDFPLSFREHQPWWNCYRLLGDYLGRLSYTLSQGKFSCDVLMLHPSGSTWTEYRVNGDNRRLLQMGEDFKQLCRTVNQLHFFYDLGDEVILQRHGKVQGNRLIVGDMSYRTVIMPEMTTIMASTFQLLKEFIQNGGVVIAAGETPTRLDGVECSQLAGFFRSPGIRKAGSGDREQLREVLKENGSTGICLQEDEGRDLSKIYCHKRNLENGQIIFLCNIDPEGSYQVRMKLDGAYKVEEWDAVTGASRNLEVYEGNEGSFGNPAAYVRLKFHPLKSYLLVTDTGCPVKPVPDAGIKENDAAVRLELKDWETRRVHSNAMPLKLCRYSARGGNWSEPMDALQADSKLASDLGFEWRSQFGRQPWMYEPALKNRKEKVQLSYTFPIHELPLGELLIAVEEPELYQVTVNGKRAARVEKAFIDRAFGLFDIKDAVKVGENEVILASEGFHICSSVEWLYLVGDFKLEKAPDGFAVAAEGEGPETGDWTRQGYPYYSGTMRYSTYFELQAGSGQRAELQLGQLWMGAARVFVNGSEAAVLGWEPYMADITGFVKSGKNEVTIEIMNTLQNLMGPHGQVDPDGFCTPGSFAYGQGDVKFVKSGFDGVAAVTVR